MKHYFLLFLLSILVFSCDLNGQEETDRIDSINLEAIASNPYYMAYAKAVQENADAIIMDMFDSDKISDYVLTNYPNEDDLCAIDFSEVNIRGIDLYMEQMCKIFKSLDLLVEKVPAFEKLSEEQKSEIHKIYSSAVNHIPPSPPHKNYK